MSTDMTGVVGAKFEVRDIGSYERLDIERKQFEGKIGNRTTTEDDLIAYVLTIDDAGYEIIPSSEGMQWIHRNPDTFVQIVGDVDRFFLRILCLSGISQDSWEVDETNESRTAHSLRYWFLKSFLLSRTLMRLLSYGMRERYIRLLYPQIGAHNNCWLHAAILNCIPREVIATAILEGLKRDRSEPGMANKVDDFLSYGGGRPEDAPVHVALRSLKVREDLIDELRSDLKQDPTVGFQEIEQRLKKGVEPIMVGFHCFPEFKPWFVLNNHELAEALFICAERSPSRVINLMDDHRLTTRLKPDARARLVTHAMTQMKSLSGLNVQRLEQLLNLEARQNLARQLVPVKNYEHYTHKPTAQFLLRILCELPKLERERFWIVIGTVLEHASASVIYCAWRQLKLDESEVEFRLRCRLEQAGYMTGTIEQGSSPNGGVQWMVQSQYQHWYVQSRDQHRYFPKKGDLVLFHTPSGRRLTPFVTAVHFTPIMKDID